MPGPPSPAAGYLPSSGAGNFSAYSPRTAVAARSGPDATGQMPTRSRPRSRWSSRRSEHIFAASGRSWIRTRVGVADGFTGRSKTCSDLRLCSALPYFSGYSPRHPCGRCRPWLCDASDANTNHSRRIPSRQAGRRGTQSNARAGAPVLHSGRRGPDARAAARMAGNGPWAHCVAQPAATSGRRGVWGQRGTRCRPPPLGRSSTRGAREPIWTPTARPMPAPNRHSHMPM
jgi:hypothetical protein